MCAPKVFKCVELCFNKGVVSPSCISCVGESYEQCKGCLLQGAPMKQSNTMLGESHSVIAKCSLKVCSTKFISGVVPYYFCK